METNPLICGTNQGTSFYKITASVLKGLTIFRITPTGLHLVRLVMVVSRTAHFIVLESKLKFDKELVVSSYRNHNAFIGD